jgi:hypothetical protein
LLTTLHITSCSLRIELRHLIESGPRLRKFLLRIETIGFVTIATSYEYHLPIEVSFDLAKSLLSFISSISAANCYSLSIDRGLFDELGYAPTFPELPCQGRIQSRLARFVSKLKWVDLCVELFKDTPLKRIALALARAPSIEDLSLQASYPFRASDFTSALPTLNLPMLQHLSIYGSVTMADLGDFLSRHPKVHDVTITNNCVPSDKCANDSRRCLPSVSHSMLSTPYVSSFFEAFRLPALRSLILFASNYEDTALSLLAHALNVLPAYSKSPIGRLKIYFPVNLDRVATNQSADPPSHEMAYYPDHDLPGVTELEAVFTSGIDASHSLVRLLTLNQRHFSFWPSQEYFVKLLSFFPSVANLEISSPPTSLAVPDLPSMILQSCPRIRFLSSPWGSWSRTSNGFHLAE